MLGWRHDEVLNWIEIHTTPVALGVPQAITCGPLLSKPMEDYCRVQGVGRSVDARLFADMRTAGLDLTDWFQARCISSVFASLAEARETGRTFDEVMASDAADGDLNDIMRDGDWCGMTMDEIQSAVWENAVLARHYIELPEVWSAVLALADKLRPGTMSGRRATRIVIEALTG